MIVPHVIVISRHYIKSIRHLTFQLYFPYLHHLNTTRLDTRQQHSGSTPPFDYRQHGLVQQTRGSAAWWNPLQAPQRAPTDDLREAIPTRYTLPLRHQRSLATSRNKSAPICSTIRGTTLNMQGSLRRSKLRSFAKNKFRVVIGNGSEWKHHKEHGHNHPNVFSSLHRVRKLSLAIMLRPLLHWEQGKEEA